MGSPIELFGTDPRRLAEHLGGRGRARQVWSLIREGRDPFDGQGLSAAAVGRLREGCRGLPVEAARRQTAADGTVRLRLVSRDGSPVETVLIPGGRRTTVCISTQVGCGRGCVFCVTAAMGLARSLSTAEIVGQVILARREAASRSLPEPRNVVLMGMGEPLDNLEAVLPAIALLADPAAIGLAPRHITLSTVGTSPAAVRRLAGTPVCLAWSIHAVDDRLRRRLIPTARAPVAALREAFLEALGRRPLFVEMTLLSQVNDSLTRAEELARFLEPFGDRARINLLPMNPGRPGHEASPEPRVIAFRQHLRGRGYFCAVRTPRGAELGAACGQLAAGNPLEEIRRTRTVHTVLKGGEVFDTAELFRSVENRLGPRGPEELDEW